MALVGGCTPEVFASLVAAFAGVADPRAAAGAVCQSLGQSAARERHLQANIIPDGIDAVAYGVDTAILIFGGALVFFMHAGFAMLEAGAIRSKNAMNILLQTVLDASASCIMWYLFGWSWAYGVDKDPSKNNEFIGSASYGAMDFAELNQGKWALWFYQWAFATTAATIPAGSVAERFNFNAYMGYSIMIASFVYPVVVHWAWSGIGWLGMLNLNPLNRLFHTGYIDFAGSGVVHMVGGFTGLCGAWMVGPRLGRFDADGNPVEMPGHSAILVVLGTLILWFGWYGFNPMSVLSVTTTAYAVAAGRSAVTTTLSGAAGGLACLVNGFRRSKSWDLIATCNGVLCGFVSITAGCSVLEPWAAILAGAVGGLWFDLICWLFLKLKIDDPVSAAPMHGFCGIWGVLVVGLLAKKEYVGEVYGIPSAIPILGTDGNPKLDNAGNAMYDPAFNGVTPRSWGAFYPGAGGELLACQVIGILAIVAWTCGIMIPFFYVFKFFNILRIPPEQEEMGLDRSKHGGSAYNQTGGHNVGNDIMRGNTLGNTSNSNMNKIVPMAS